MIDTTLSCSTPIAAQPATPRRQPHSFTPRRDKAAVIYIIADIISATAEYFIIVNTSNTMISSYRHRITANRNNEHTVSDRIPTSAYHGTTSPGIRGRARNRQVSSE
jgi:hypothetical protein